MGAGFSPGNDPDRDALVFEIKALRDENAALKRSESMLRLVVDAVGDSVHAKDEEGQYILANPATARVLNRTVAEVIGQDDTALFSPEFARQIMANDRLTVCRDVTDPKRAEETLQTSEKLFRAVFEGALVAMVLVDDDGRYVNANPAACELFGLPLGELLGRSIADFSEPDFDVCAGRDEFRKSGSAQGLFRLVRPDGTVRETEFAATADVLPGRHLSVLRDVSERRRAQESLRKSERRVAAILESITDAFFAVDRQWRFTYVNAQAQRLLDRCRRTSWARTSGKSFRSPSARRLSTKPIGRSPSRSRSLLKSTIRARSGNGSAYTLIHRSTGYRSISPTSPNGRMRRRHCVATPRK